MARANADGVDVDSVFCSMQSIRRKRIANRLCESQRIYQIQKNKNTVLTVHWDGKAIKDGRGTKTDTIAVVISDLYGERVINVLEVPYNSVCI